MMLIPCACGHSPVDHEHNRVGLDCGKQTGPRTWCDCPRYRPVRLRWYQFWRARPDIVWFTVFDLELLSARPEEIT